MAIQFKDYYQILGISRSASEEEIRKAFRKLARLYHPDKTAGDPVAEDKFKEINEAYEVLGDPDKRRTYDEFGERWWSGDQFPEGTWDFTDLRRFGAEQQQSRSGQFTFHGTGFSDFFDQLFSQGGQKFRPQKEKYRRESVGSQSGGFHKEPEPEFPPHGAKGEDLEADILVTLDEVCQGSIRPITVKRAVLCQTCFGAGNFNGHTCQFCEGTGQGKQGVTCKVKVPRGVREGALLRIPGQGEESVSGGPSGDLYLKVRYAGHPDFKVVGDSLQHEVELAPWEAVLGAEVSVPLLDGSRLTIRVPAGTQSGQKLRVRGKGLPRMDGSDGDLVISVAVQVPRTCSEKEKQLWAELARESRFHPREHHH